MLDYSETRSDIVADLMIERASNETLRKENAYLKNKIADLESQIVAIKERLSTVENYRW